MLWRKLHHKIYYWKISITMLKLYKYREKTLLYIFEILYQQLIITNGNEFYWIILCFNWSYCIIHPQFQIIRKFWRILRMQQCYFGITNSWLVQSCTCIIFKSFQKYFKATGWSNKPAKVRKSLRYDLFCC